MKGGLGDERGVLVGGKWKTNECTGTTNDGPRIVLVSAVIHD